MTVDSRSDLLVGMDDGLCEAAIVGIEEMHAYHGKGEHCTKERVGYPVLEMPWGIPVSEEYVLPLETVISEVFQQGVCYFHFYLLSLSHIIALYCHYKQQHISIT